MQKGPTVRINRQIRVPKVRLIDSEGGQLGIVATEDALRIAEEKEQDLVEVAPNSQPPVCRIMDYGKFKYQQSKKVHEAKKRQTVVKLKEIKLRPKTDDHDIGFKIEQARRFLLEGKKVKFTMVFRGREITHTDIGRAIMDHVVGALADAAGIEQAARFEGKAMFMILAAGAKKKGPYTPPPAVKRVAVPGAPPIPQPPPGARPRATEAPGPPQHGVSRLEAATRLAAAREVAAAAEAPKLENVTGGSVAPHTEMDKGAEPGAGSVSGGAGEGSGTGSGSGSGPGSDPETGGITSDA